MCLRCLYLLPVVRFVKIIDRFKFDDIMHNYYIVRLVDRKLYITKVNKILHCTLDRVWTKEKEVDQRPGIAIAFENFVRIGALLIYID